MLRELGRLVLAAIELERTAYSVCRCIRPRHGPLDDACPIGTRIGEAMSDLDGCPDEPMKTYALGWLAEARDTLANRNQVLHATPGYYAFMRDGAWHVGEEEHLVSAPKKVGGSGAVTPLTVAGLRPLRERAERALIGWLEIALHTWASYPGSKSWGTPQTPPPPTP